MSDSELLKYPLLTVDDSNKILEDNISNFDNELDYNEKLDQDFETIRNTSLNIISQSQVAIDEALLLARETQKPNAYETVSILLQTSLEASKTIMQLHDNFRKMKGINVPQKIESQNITNNNLSLTTAELSKLMKELKEEKSIN